ncbi:MAG: hypothetical protein OEW78_05790 [Nitrosopumilus sp.]|uniref:hypothetical protein n=1 Tax=Nitrosopumilus sp. TaxID=2024843 RepID=UPI00247264D4|nr:hypothetical protein [Nitrosopumilus sp.]MDH5431377.1 hypothetical protein [Nitrosopumilus sp.]
MTEFDYVGWIAAIAAAIGLGFTAFQLRANNKTRQLELVETIYHDIHSLEQLFYERYTGNPKKEEHWRTLFFQQLEWFAFLVNEKKIKDKKSIDFFKPAFIDWCKYLFLEFADEDQITNPTRFEELKKLYTKFTGQNLQKT